MNPADKKIAAAKRALDYVQPGMVIGLGTGSTAAAFVDLLAEKVVAGLDVTGVPTSTATEEQAKRVGIPLTTLEDKPFLDLTIDGADELDDQLRLIKGGGGALLREKIVATASDRMIVIADDSKHVRTLGRFPLPIEIVTFGIASTRAMIAAMAHELDLDGELTLRTNADSTPFRTDCGNFVLDCAFAEIPEPEALADLLNAIPGVVDHGLFLGLADICIVAGDAGVTVLEANYDGEDDSVSV